MAVAFGHRGDLVLVCFSDELSTEDLLYVAEHLDQVEDTAPGLPRLADLTATTGIRISDAGLHRLAEDRRQRRFTRLMRTAILVNSEAMFAFARMYKGYLQHPQVAVEIFRERDQALAWLGGRAKGSA